LAHLTGDGAALPPDWATIEQSQSADSVGLLARAIPAPDQAESRGGSSGLDAERVAVREADSCVPADRQISASMAALYRDKPGLSSYSLGGEPTGTPHATGFVAAAAADWAAGDGTEADRLLTSAEDEDAANPTYYGSAWVALGRVMLDSSALGECPGGRG